MRVLLTGDRGVLGSVVRRELVAAGHEVTGFDLADGHDVRDTAAVGAAASGHDAIVHLAGLPGDKEDRPDQVMAINLVGTWNVLLAARTGGAGRVVFCSSGKALGMLERNPEYLPVDDAPWPAVAAVCAVEVARRGAVRGVYRGDGHFYDLPAPGVRR